MRKHKISLSPPLHLSKEKPRLKVGFFPVSTSSQLCIETSRRLLKYIENSHILQNPQILASSRKPLRRENDPKSLILVDVAFVTWLDILEEYNSVSY